MHLKQDRQSAMTMFSKRFTMVDKLIRLEYSIIVVNIFGVTVLMTSITSFLLIVAFTPDALMTLVKKCMFYQYTRYTMLYGCQQVLDVIHLCVRLCLHAPHMVLFSQVVFV